MSRYNSIALEQQATIKDRAGRLSQVLCYNSNAADRFLHIYDLGRAVTAEVVGVAEVNSIDFGGLTAAGLDGDYFSFYSASGLTKVWFDLDGASVEPTLDGSVASIEVDIATGDTVDQIASKVDAVLDVYDVSLFSTSVTTDTVTITQASTGVRQNISAGTTGAVVATSAEGVDAVPSPLLSLVSVVPVAAGQTVSVPFASGERIGLDMTAGIVLANSTTGPTYTAGSADSWFTAIFE
jgi:hypothetical protein